MSLRETCKCGHDRASHYAEPNTGKACGCLCTACECKRYRWEFAKEERDTLPAPRVDAFWGVKTPSSIPPSSDDFSKLFDDWP